MHFYTEMSVLFSHISFKSYILKPNYPLSFLFLSKLFRNYQKEAELARMSWKVKPEDLLLNHMDNKFGSRLSLGRFSAAAVI